MRFVRDAIITLVALLLVLGGFAYVQVRGGGFSTTDQPGQLEKTDHFNHHCAVCHGRDGHGRTEIGENMYPKVPDFAARAFCAAHDLNATSDDSRGAHLHR